MKPVIISACCKSAGQKELLYNLCLKLCKSDFYVIVASHWQVEESTQLLSDVVIYDRNDPTDFSRGMTHGVAECISVEQALMILRYYGYKEAFKLTYDCTINDVSIFDEWKNRAVSEGKKMATAPWGDNTVGTLAWWADIDFVSGFIYPRTVDEMFRYGGIIETAWYNHAQKLDMLKDIYFYNNYEEMFGPKNIYNHFMLGGQVRRI